MNKQKTQSGFAHLIIITVILGLGLVGTLGYVFYQNFMQKKDSLVKTDDSSKIVADETKDDNIAVDEKANWKTYTNTTYGFSFRYPSSWSVQDSPSKNVNNVPSPNPTLVAINPNGDDFRVFIAPSGVGGWGFEGNYRTIDYTVKVDEGKLTLIEKSYYAGSENEKSLGYIIKSNFGYAGNDFNIISTGEDTIRMDKAKKDYAEIISTWKFN